MEVIVDHPTLLIGQNVPIILHLLEMEHVMIILKSKLSAIMIFLIAVNIMKLLAMVYVTIQVIPVSAILMVEIALNV